MSTLPVLRQHRLCHRYGLPGKCIGSIDSLRRSFDNYQSLFENAVNLLNFFIRPKRSIASGELCKHSTGQKNGVHAFGYNSAESEPIWMKAGALSTLLGAGHGRFWARSAQ